MTISAVKRVKSIVKRILPRNVEQRVIIYQPIELEIGAEFIPDHPIISFNCFIKNLKIFASIESLESSPFPIFDLEDSDSVKLQKALDIEWKSARKQLDVLINDGSIGNYDNPDGWQIIGSISLLNSSGYPYRIYNLMDVFTDTLAIELGSNTRVAVAIKDVGFGVLDNLDTVVVHGSYVEEILVKDPILPPATVNVYVSGTTSGGGGTEVIEQPSAGSTLINNENLVGNASLIGN